jgi:hypothetical protein
MLTAIRSHTETQCLEKPLSHNVNVFGSGLSVLSLLRKANRASQTNGEVAMTSGLILLSSCPTQAVFLRKPVNCDPNPQAGLTPVWPYSSVDMNQRCYP